MVKSSLRKYLLTENKSAVAFNADFNSSADRKFSTDSGKYLYALELENND